MIPPVIAALLLTFSMLYPLPPVPGVEYASNQITQYEEVWQPSEEDIAYLSRTVWGEVRGCDEVEQRAQVWCVLNRVDDPRFPDSIEEVVTAPYQFQGYSPSNPVEPFEEMAREILTLWHNGEREIPADMCFCSGDGKHQRFRTEWISTSNTRYYP